MMRFPGSHQPLLLSLGVLTGKGKQCDAGWKSGGKETTGGKKKKGEMDAGL